MNKSVEENRGILPINTPEKLNDRKLQKDKYYESKHYYLNEIRKLKNNIEIINIENKHEKNELENDLLENKKY
jgi:hypothetical protein